MTIDEVLKMRQNASGLNQLMHMKVQKLDKTGAVVQVELTPNLLNPLGVAHGGTTFALCDIAAGTAAAANGRVAVTLDSNIHYYKPGIAGKTLTATATCRKHGKNTAVYFVSVVDDDGTEVADAMFTMFYTAYKIEDLR